MLPAQLEDLDTGRPDAGPRIVGDELLEQQQVDEIPEAVVLLVGGEFRARMKLLGDLVAHGQARDVDPGLEPEAESISSIRACAMRTAYPSFL